MALSVNVNVPVAEPTAVGEKVTPTVQLAPAATPAPQVLLATANGPLTPLTATLLTVSAVFRRFVSVIMRVEFVASTTLPKLKLVGENVTGALLVVPATCIEKESDVGVIEAPGVVPVPLRVTTCEEPKL